MPLAFGLSSVLPFLTITVFVVVFVILNLKSSPSVTASALYPFSEVRVTPDKLFQVTWYVLTSSRQINHIRNIRAAFYYFIILITCF